jgi:hypothetical protein
MSDEQLVVIRNELDYRHVQATLSRRKAKPRLLRALMSLFERYRQARKIGWSRPWNKHGVRTFAAFRVLAAEDQHLLGLASRVVHDVVPRLSPRSCALHRDVFSGAVLPMGFVFLSEIEEGGRRFESVTLSLGRVAPGHPRHRDRIDIVLDSEIVEDASEGITRVRVYLDPFDVDRTPAEMFVADGSFPPTAAALFLALITATERWQIESTRAWEHWTSAYIDYFGARRWGLRRACFDIGLPLTVAAAAS